MTCIKDICRICLQEVEYVDVEPINLDKLGRLIKKSLLPKWHLEFFEGHVICNTCIDNFRTLRNLYKFAWSSNGQIMRHRRYLKSRAIDLKELKQHNKLQSKLEPFLLCRLCFEPTKNAAVYLFDSPHNIVPLEYINCMIKHVHLYLTMLESTVSPILCFKCWQRIEVAFAFRKHIDTISEKVLHYQKLLNKSYLDKEDLQDVFYMLDKLGLHPSADSENSISEEELSTEQNMSSAYIFFEEHNYFKKETSNSCNTGMPILNNETFKKASGIDGHMPVLTPNIEANTEDFKDCKVPTRTLRNKTKAVAPVTQNKDKIVIHSNKLLSKAKPKKRKHKNLINGLSMEVSSLPKNKQKLVSILKSKMERQQQQNSTWSDTVEISDEILRPRTRLSAKKEMSIESPLQDLLVLRKEEIIKKKPLRNASKPLNPQHTSTPKITENPQMKTTKRKQPLSKQSTNPEYTFERLNFDNEIQNDKNTIEQAAIQIKKEVISDSDDDFTENGKDIMGEDDDEPCPNLDAFIKTEPEEIMDVNDDDIDEPPELEFQGPCSYDPHFTISNTFTVSDKRHMITLDEKRDLLDSLGDNNSKSPEKPVNLPSLNGTFKSINEKPPLVKVKNAAKLDQKPHFKEVVVNLTKCCLEEQVLKANSHNKNVDIKPKAEIRTIKPGHMIPIVKSNRKSVAERESKPNSKKEMKQLSEARSLPNASDAKPQVPSQAAPSLIEVLKSDDLFIKKTTLSTPKSESSFTKKKLSTSTVSEANKNKKNDKSLLNLSLIESYNEVDQMVSRKHPFDCKMCDFKTTSKRGAKCHLTLHSTDAASLHFCNLCSYHTTNKVNLKIHCSKAHSRDSISRRECGYCHSRDAKLKCLDCQKFFHPKCALEDQSVKESNCSHDGIIGCVQILRNKSVILAKGNMVWDCDYCKKFVKNWVNCKSCKKFFHYKCFHASRAPGEACLHLFLGFSTATNPKISLRKVDDKKIEQKRNCNFCGNVLDSVIPCPMCFKFMHSACFQQDSKIMKFNCNHKDIVGEVPVAKCGYCQKNVEHNAINCKLCNRTLHRYCFVVDRIKKTLNCQHMADIVLTASREEPSTPEVNDEFPCTDAQTPSMSQPIPTTSREIKQDLLDLADFIMLCD